MSLRHHLRKSSPVWTQHYTKALGKKKATIRREELNERRPRELTCLFSSFSSFLFISEDFCNVDNFDQTSAFVNHQLGIHGFMANLQFLKGDKQNASRVVSALYKVLQQHQKDIQYKEEMDLNWRRLSNDYDTAVQNLVRISPFSIIFVCVCVFLDMVHFNKKFANGKLT